MVCASRACALVAVSALAGLCASNQVGQTPTCSPAAAATPLADEEEESLFYQRKLVRNQATAPIEAQESPAASDGASLLSPKEHGNLSGLLLAETSVELVEPNLTDKAKRLLDKAEKAAGIKSNQHGDFDAMISALETNFAMMVFCFVMFLFLRYEYPLMYENNILKGLCHISYDDFPRGAFGWMKVAWFTTTEELEPHMGLDNAMLLEFAELGMRIMLRIAVPLCLVLAPMDLVFGDKHMDNDRLSRISINNLSHGHWMVWVHTAMVWYVVLVVQLSVFGAQRSIFLPRRTRWLQTLPEPRASTVLVEGIPEECCSDEALFQFFGNMFGSDKVKSAYVVKQTDNLLAALAERDAAKAGIAESEAEERLGAGKRYCLCLRRAAGQQKLCYTEQEREANVAVKAERKKIQNEMSICGGVNMTNGFVTFHERTDAELAKSIEYSTDHDEWAVSTPPDPRMILWDDLKQANSKQVGKEILGYGLMVGLYMGYLPAIVAITAFSKNVKLGPVLQPFWEGVAPTMGLQFMVAFLPTFILIILRECFTLKADAWAQHKLQQWYFAFQVVFVILVTAIGSDVVLFARTLLMESYAIFGVLAETMPIATHFYMNFLVLQWVTHSSQMLRYVPLMKFMALRKLYEDEEARELSEPEDQDYYGLGSRSARWTINLLIGFIFSTLSPLVSLICLADFFICRVVYGYLIPYAETRKPDLGGVFWVSQLEHIFSGLVIYVLVMGGVVYGRTGDPVQTGIIGLALLYVVGSYYRFRTEFNWEKLPFPELKRHPAKVERMPLKFEQPELVEDSPTSGQSVKA